MQSLSLAAGVLTLAILTPAVSSAQSLADVAKAEEARRKTLRGPSKVYTNDDLRGKDAAPRPADVTPAKAAPAVSGMPQLPSSTGAATKPAVPAPPAETRDEKYWRSHMGAARAALQRSQAFLDALQSHINGLSTEFVNMNDPLQRAAIEQKRLEALAEQNRVKADIAVQTKAIAAIEDEARRASIPPGWLR
jgi:hypothetical protein